MDDNISISPLFSFFQFFKPFFFTYHNEPNFSSSDSRIGQDYYRPNMGPSLPNDSGHSPRDALLKPNHSEKRAVPSTEKENVNILAPFHHPGSESFQSPWSDDTFGSFFSQGFPGGGFDSLFGMMDQLLEKSQQFHSELFKDGFDLSKLPSVEPKAFDEKRDTDLDDSSNKEIASLLKETPFYQYDSARRPPDTHSRFHSTTIVRIRRPDGVIEETKKYRDSSGREEIEVITREPGSENSPQLQDPFHDNRQQNPFQDSGSGGFFRRFPFSFF